MTGDTYPYWLFDDSAIPDPFGYGEAAINFLRLLRHPKSTLPKRQFFLAPFQERLIRKIYGDCHSDGRRKTRNVIIMLPRGGRKTSLAAAIGLISFLGPARINGGQVLFAASDREQARLGYSEAEGILKADARIEKACRFIDYRHRIIHPKSGSQLVAISSDAARSHGSTPTCAIVDELHIHKSRDLWESIRTGLAKTPNSLLCVISTAGRGQQNVAWDTYDYARKVARGDIEDEGTLPILFETPADADWEDEAVWRRVNPGLDYGFPDIEGLRQLAREARERVSERESFKQLHLCQWLDSSANPWVDLAIWDEGKTPLDMVDDLASRPCYLGVDLSSNSDLTAVVAVWKVGDGYAVLPHCFCPADNLRGRQDRDKVPYVRWAESGLITATDGTVIDYRVVEDCIRDLCARFDVRAIGLDPHLARSTINNLLEDGYPAIEVRQGWATMAPAIKEFERAVLGRELIHGGHELLRWCVGNILVETDRAGNRLFTKSKAKDKIDPAVAAAIAIHCATNDDDGFVYTEALRPDGILFL
jgi:phage terminase large subunit-like protein